MGRGRVEVVVDLLDVFAVVAYVCQLVLEVLKDPSQARNSGRTLRAVQAVQALFQDRVLAIPETESETQALMVVPTIVSWRDAVLDLENPPWTE